MGQSQMISDIYVILGEPLIGDMFRVLRASLVLLLCLHTLASAEEGAEQSTAPFGEHHGYLFDVQEERNKRDLEMVMLDKPKPAGKPLNEVIFNEKLSKEFQTQYQYRF